MIGKYVELTLDTFSVDPSTDDVAGAKCIVRLRNNKRDKTAIVEGENSSDAIYNAGAMCADCALRFGGCDKNEMTTPQGELVEDVLALTGNQVFLDGYIDRSLEYPEELED